MEFLVFAFLIIVSFFILYELSRNDFVLLRKNISLVQIFDYGFVILGAGFIVSRLFYILDTRSFLYLNPIAFLHIVRLPGLSVLGFFLGMVLALVILLRKKKSLQRVYDIFYLSMFPLFIGSVIFMSIPRPFFYIPIIIILLSLLLYAILISFLRNYTLKDGSISLIILMIISGYSFMYPFFLNRPHIVQSLSLIQLFSAAIFIGLLFTFVYYQLLLQNRSR